MSNQFYRIYLVTNIITLANYVGYTSKTLLERRKKHIWQISYKNHKKKKQYFFHSAIAKYGIENFVWTTIYTTENKGLALHIMETLMICRHKSHWTQGGYNMTWGGDSPPHTGKGMTGKHHSKETKQLLRNSSKGRKHSEKTKAKIRESSIGKHIPWNTGKHLPQEMKDKISKSNTGRIVSDETRQKLRTANLGKKHSETTKQKLREIYLEKHHTEEAKQKEAKQKNHKPHNKV